MRAFGGTRGAGGRVGMDILTILAYIQGGNGAFFFGSRHVSGLSNEDRLPKIERYHCARSAIPALVLCKACLTCFQL